ncbi:MAG: synthase subunit alpha, partial [Candidatus Adlerbacteria bacterium]|nr:synthase subunit alpha [Candidatus Adlerbacteria bacterium]
FRELEAFMQFSQDLDPDTKRRIEFGQRLTAILKQKNNQPLSLAAQVVSIYAAVNGYLANVSVDRVPEFEEKLITYLETNAPAILESIMRARDLASQTEEELKAQITKFIDQHPDLVKTA